MFRLYPERPADTAEVELLFDLAFAPGRTALSSYRLRDGVPMLGALSLVARDDYDVVAGAIRYWPVVVGQAAAAPALLLGPIAVHPTRQGEGLGALLMSESLSRARALGWRRVLLVGDRPYYARFGFDHVPVEFPAPTNQDRVLGLALTEGALDGFGGAVAPWPAARAAMPG
ncbi:GNAT family N-acetyltransferase [Rhodobacteraceae bacterium 2CG4]|uniref:GNAT family N-acetyltransferase n=1 Tax=Halovulum marinum TaxID=2662447 RepID=A0A6L5Z4M5_9RHOB|nr:N-acetyltransferase [Halovulum marinum]MSU91503.1 GNAT family N-acetyltransferase [Halovulum marinum]